MKTAHIGTDTSSAAMTMAPPMSPRISASIRRCDDSVAASTAPMLPWPIISSVDKSVASPHSPARRSATNLAAAPVLPSSSACAVRAATGSVEETASCRANSRLPTAISLRLLTAHKGTDISSVAMPMAPPMSPPTSA